jgi:YVTN family beta-propeller protein
MYLLSRLSIHRILQQAVIVLLAALILSASANALSIQGEIENQPRTVTATFSGPTTSSPIALSADNTLVWSVNPDDNSVSIIRTDTNAVITRIAVGQQPESVAPDPNHQYVYVANAASNSVSVIRISNNTNADTFSAQVVRTFVTGAEPWNLVISPDGKRVYVANSAQDTITIIKSDVLSPTLPSIIGNVNLRNSNCNSDDANRHFQPRGLAVTADSTKLYVTRFLSFVKPGGVQASNTGKVGLVCRLDINTAGLITATSITAYTAITLAARDSGFPSGSSEFAYPNQLQSIVIRGNTAYVPNIAAAPALPLKFDSDTHAFINRIGGAATSSQTDDGALNLQLGGRIPESGKTRLFFANPWALAFTNQSGSGTAYVVSAGSDLLVKLYVDAAGNLAFTNGVSTTRYIDLNDPANPAANAGKNPLGIAINTATAQAYVMNYVSRNVSVINLTTDAVASVITLTNRPAPGSQAEIWQVGKEIFYSSRGNFVRPGGTTVSTTNRLSSEGWQSCSSCHFAGLTDGNIWVFDAGPRKSIPLAGTWNPHNANDQRVLNYSATRDEVQDFELSIRNISGPGPLAVPINGNSFDPNHGLIISDTGDINTPPITITAFTSANSGRQQLRVKLPGSGTSVAALDALKEWGRYGIRIPNGMLTTVELTAGGGDPTGGLTQGDVDVGRTLFFSAGCIACHNGGKWSSSAKYFTSPPSASLIATENPPIATTVNLSYLYEFLRDIGSYKLGVAGGGNLIGNNIGAPEVAADGKAGLGVDTNSDGKGNGFNVPSLLGIWSVPPYYHNGACETLLCVLNDYNHRTVKGTRPDLLSSPTAKAQLVAFLQSLDAQTSLFKQLFLPLVLR